MEPRPNHAAQTLVGLFEPGAPLGPALERCMALGIPESSLRVLSTVPLSRPLALQTMRPALHHWTLLGGIIGLLSGMALAAGTALLYPLNTGNFPIVAPPVIGLVAYESMMLSAVFLTFVAMAREIRRERPAPNVPEIDDGLIGLSIVPTGDSFPIAALRSALLEAGAMKVVQIQT